MKEKEKAVTKSTVYKITELKSLNKNIKSVISSDLKKITSKRKSIHGMKFHKPQIMGVLNITPDSFSDGGLFFNKIKSI